MSYFDKTYHPPGTPPGTLLEAEAVSSDQFIIYLVDYSSTEFVEKQLETAQDCEPYLSRDSVTWIHVQGQFQLETIKNIGNIFELHPLALEDILNKGQRPKWEEYDDLLFVIMAMPNRQDDTFTVDQVSIFLGKNYIISFCGSKLDSFRPLRKRLSQKIGRIRHLKADYLLYCILDIVVDQGYPVLEHFAEQIELIEEELLKASANQKNLASIHHIRRELLLLRRNIWPQREILNELLRDENSFIQKDTRIYFRDCYDHTIQILEITENYREMATSLLDVHRSTVSQRLNEIIRVLTMISTIFIPLTFVVGLYGMNFSHPDSPWAMPELGWYYGYPIVWGVMVLIVIGMLVYFKRKCWL